MSKIVDMAEHNIWNFTRLLIKLELCSKLAADLTWYKAAYSVLRVSRWKQYNADTK